MRILNFNIRFGGGKRIQLILDFILSNDFDLIVLTEFVKNNHGQEPINYIITLLEHLKPNNNYY